MQEKMFLIDDVFCISYEKWVDTSDGGWLCLENEQFNVIGKKNADTSVNSILGKVTYQNHTSISITLSKATLSPLMEIIPSDKISEFSINIEGWHERDCFISKLHPDSEWTKFDSYLDFLREYAAVHPRIMTEVKHEQI